MENVTKTLDPANVNVVTQKTVTESVPNVSNQMRTFWYMF